MPSIQLATLASALEKEELESDVHELYVDYAARIGLNLYNQLDNLLGYLPEWIFSRHYFGPEQGDDLPGMIHQSPLGDLPWPELGESILAALEPVTRGFLDDAIQQVGLLSLSRVVTRGAPAKVPEIPHPRELASTLAFAEAEHWYACGPPPVGTRQGWKLYVPITMLNARALTKRLGALLLPAGLHFKYVKSIATLRKLNAGLYGYGQIGKCFVIYLPVPDATLIEALKEALLPYRDQCPAVPCARPFGDRLPLYYRFGAYGGTTLVVNDAEVADDRTNLATAVPEGVIDTLAPWTTADPDDPPSGASCAGTRSFRRSFNRENAVSSTLWT